MIAKAYDVSAKRISNPVKLSLLCVRFLSTLCSPQTIDRLVGEYKENNRKNLTTPDYPDTSVKFESYLKTLALKPKVTVVLPKLRKVTVQHWTKMHWTQVDPYSDIEVVDDSENDIAHEVADLSSQHSDPDEIHADNNPYFDVIGGRILRKRKRSYSADRSRRSGSEHQFYRDMCSPDQHRWITRSAEPKGPSHDRLKSQEMIQESNNRKRLGIKPKNVTRSYPMFQPKRKPKSEKMEITVTDDLTADHDDEAPVDTVNEHPSVKQKRGKAHDDSIVIECSVKTKTYGLRKPKHDDSKTVDTGTKPAAKPVRVRKYTCPLCKKSFNKLAMLNEHYRDKHPPLQCKTCNKEFCTPSTLEHHSYIHGDLKFECKMCGVRFPFESMRDSHQISHLKEPKHKCKEPKCGKKFFYKGDLVKHEKVHNDDIFNCILCDYSNSDERNLKAHMRVHSNLKRYICPKCNELFKYHTQMSRHFPCKNKPVGNTVIKPMRSRSPDF